jgi:hypothetical protein
MALSAKTWPLTGRTTLAVLKSNVESSELYFLVLQAGAVICCWPNAFRRRSFYSFSFFK